jgi:D-amino peptidase
MQMPVTLDVRFKSYRPVQMLSYLPIVEQTDSHTIRYIGSTIVDISKFIEFITSYNVAIEP